MIMRVRELVDGDPVIAGSSTGRRLFAKLIDLAMSKSGGPAVMVLSFAGIEVATSSCLRECVVEFRQRVREMKPDTYVVVADLSENVEEELRGLLSQIGEAIWVFETKRNKVVDQRLIGRLDPKLMETLEVIRAKKRVDAQALWKAEKSQSVGVTAWNNRLATLSKQGLVIETREGKTKIYQSLRGGER
jgi:hypothetical protein